MPLYIYGMSRKWPWTLKSFVREMRAGQSGMKALKLRRIRPKKRRSVRGQWRTIRLGEIHSCLSLEGERGRLRERMLEQRVEAVAVIWTERAVTELRSGMREPRVSVIMGKEGSGTR